jgi:hypothetical protein
VTREQRLAVGNGLIGLGCSVFEVSVLALLFSTGHGRRRR